MQKRVSVDTAQQGMRLDKFLSRVWPELSRSQWQALLKKAAVTVNGRPGAASQSVRSGDEIQATLPEACEPPAIGPVAMPLRVLFEDDWVLVLDKAAGISVHPGAGTRGEPTLVQGLLHHCRWLSRVGGPERPGIVHRLDKETSGCLVVAKTDAAHKCLARQFAQRHVEKHYLAVVQGVPSQKSGVVQAPIGRHPVQRQKMTVVREGRPGRPAETAWEVLVCGEKMALLLCRPRTGRTHQIRVHLKHIGHPLLGDEVYGKRGQWQRHLLHAWRLGFTHPGSGEWMLFESPVPGEFPLSPPGCV